jgi:protein tyrosine phosphatase (PTP) superfamily phosphohydrolase (DUF442 family)
MRGGTALPTSTPSGFFRWPLAAAALALAPGCGACGGRAPAAAAPARRAFAEPVAGIKNMARMNAGLYRGAQPDREGFQRLREMGIRTVVNLRDRHGEREEVEGLGMACVEIPMKAGLLDADPPRDDQVRRFFEVVLDPARAPVYFHCAHGRDRTGTMAALYRIEVEGWTPEEAIEEMRAFGHPELLRDLEAFVRAYRPRGFRASGSR